MTPPRRLVLIRHGQTAWNLGRRVQGQTDVELDDTGHARAAELAVHLARLGPAALWSSDLARARQTAAYLSKETGLEPVHDERLREYHLGGRQGLTHAEYAAVAPEEFEEFRRGRYDVAPGAEQTERVRERMVAGLTALLGSVGPGELALAVSHGAAIKVALTALLGWPVSSAGSLNALDNCGWAVLQETADGGGMRLSAYNRVVSD